MLVFFFFQAEDGIRDFHVTGVQTCALPIYVSADYRLRVSIFLTATSFLASYTTRYTWAFLKRDGMHRKPLTLAKGMWRLFGYKGLISGTVVDYLQYLRPDFHPWQQDDSHMIAEWRKVLEQHAPQEAA